MAPPHQRQWNRKKTQARKINIWRIQPSDPNVTPLWSESNDNNDNNNGNDKEKDNANDDEGEAAAAAEEEKEESEDTRDDSSRDETGSVFDSDMDKSVARKKDTRERPLWSLNWMPTWLVTMHPLVQLAVGLMLYIFHLGVLSQHGIAFPVQLIPNKEGRFQSIGWDSLAGILCFIGLIGLRQATRTSETPAVPSLWRGPLRNEAPWKLPTFGSGKKKSKWWWWWWTTSPHASAAVTLGLLSWTYFSTSQISNFYHVALYGAAGMGLPLSIAMHRSLVVLLGHLTWVGLGSLLLRTALQPQPFFPPRGQGQGRNGGGDKNNKIKTRAKATTTRTTRMAAAVLENGDGNGEEENAVKTPKTKKSSKKKQKKKKKKWRWYTNTWDTYWLWWTIGGYYVSSWLFNISDFINQAVLPSQVFEMAGEGVVSQLINPENNDFGASLVGYIAPCITAPWWEEVLYRGFLLPALTLYVKFWPAVLWSGILFSLHHLSPTGAIPLAVLGWTWAALYAKSGNLLVTIFIHAMWNSRVFLGSWLGL